MHAATLCTVAHTIHEISTILKDHPSRQPPMMRPPKSDETQIQHALSDLRLNSDQKIQNVANKYGVARSTLSRRLRTVTQSREEGYDS